MNELNGVYSNWSVFQISCQFADIFSHLEGSFCVFPGKHEMQQINEVKFQKHEQNKMTTSLYTCNMSTNNTIPTSDGRNKYVVLFIDTKKKVCIFMTGLYKPLILPF